MESTACISNIFFVILYPPLPSLLPYFHLKCFSKPLMKLKYHRYNVCLVMYYTFCTHLYVCFIHKKSNFLPPELFSWGTYCPHRDCMLYGSNMNVVITQSADYHYFFRALVAANGRSTVLHSLWES